MDEELTLFEKREINEYFLVISPSDEINRDVMMFRQNIYAKLNSSAKNQFSKAHISLVNFSVPSLSEQQIIDYTKKALYGIEKFTVRLNNYEIFHHGPDLRTVCLKVENHEPIIRVFNSLFTHFNFNPERLTPHITLAKTISVTEFDQIKDITILYDYQKKFDCEGLTLLKRVKRGNIHIYEFVTEIKF